MGFLEKLVLPALIVAIVLLTYIAMRGDKRARERLAEAARAETPGQDADPGQDGAGARADRR